MSDRPVCQVSAPTVWSQCVLAADACATSGDSDDGGGLQAVMGGVPIADRPRGFPRYCAIKLLALCNMKTLYLRNVPEDVVRRLQLLADRDGTSVGALAVRELSDVSRRADNPALMAKLPDLSVDVPKIVEGVEQERATR